MGLRLHAMFASNVIPNFDLTQFIHDNSDEIVREVITRMPPEKL